MNQLTADEQRVLDVVERVIAPLVALGRANVRVTQAATARGALIEVIPPRQAACPVTLHCEAPADLELFVGRHALTTQMFAA